MLKEFIENGGSLDDFINRVRDYWYQAFGDNEAVWTFVVDTFDDHVVICWNVRREVERKYYQVGITVTEDVITFADPADWIEVMLTYVPVSQIAEAVAEGTMPPGNTELIEAMQGSIEVIEADGKRQPEAVIVVEGRSANDNVYTLGALESGVPVFSGARIFADHPHKAENPERSIDRVVGRMGEAYVGEDKNGKPALRAPFYISEAEPNIKTKIKEGLIGDLSIHAAGRGKRADDGAFIVEAFVSDPHTSVDLVTVASAGGYAELAEAAQPEPDPEKPVDEAAPATEIALLLESKEKLAAENRQLREVAGSRIMQEMIPAKWPKIARERVAQSGHALLETYVSGERDGVEFREAFSELVEAERDYLSQIVPHGVVSGLQAPPQETVDPEEILTEALRGLVPEEGLKAAVKGR